jgi:hypothetical protein
MQLDKEYQRGCSYMVGWLTATIRIMESIADDGTIPTGRRLQQVRDLLHETQADIAQWQEARAREAELDAVFNAASTLAGEAESDAGTYSPI